MKAGRVAPIVAQSMETAPELPTRWYRARSPPLFAHASPTKLNTSTAPVTTRIHGPSWVLRACWMLT